MHPYQYELFYGSFALQIILTISEDKRTHEEVNKKGEAQQ
jgi:hypothetical protein